jgi:hypothetical protein
MPQTTVHRILRKSLRLKPTSYSSPETYSTRRAYIAVCGTHVRTNFGTRSFLSRIIFTDEAKFHISGSVSRHNCIIWDSEPPREHLGHERDRPKANVWCSLTHERVSSQFSLMRTLLQAIHS